RRGGQGGGRPCGALGTRWLHARPRHRRSICDFGRGLHVAFRHARRFDAGRAAAQRAVLDDRAQKPAGEQPQGASGMAQAQQRLGIDRRHREPCPLLRHGIPEGEWHGLPVHTLSCRRASLAGPGRGNIDLNCDFASNSLAQYRNGNIKVYAVMANTRWAPAPEVPTTDEAGFPGIYISTWLGLWAPKNTPADIVAKVNAAALAAMADPDARKRIADLGMQMPPPERLTPATFAAFHRAEVEKWYPIIKAAGIKAE